MHYKKLCVLILICGYFLRPTLAISQPGTGKKIIEFGWDYPKVSYLERNLSSMQNTPFDGVVFSFDFKIYDAFDTTQYSNEFFQYGKLKKLNWGKFTDNFLLIRGAGTTGSHWLDDKAWEKICNNMKRISMALKESKAVGIGFDPEYYGTDSTLNPWIYRTNYYPNISYQELGFYIRKRGKQFMQSLQLYKPDIKVLSFWLLGWILEQKKRMPLSQTSMALFPFFLEGMLEGQSKLSKIIDGNEGGYGFTSAAQFVLSGKKQRNEGSDLIMPSLRSKFKLVKMAQPVFFDLIYAKDKMYERGYNPEEKKSWLRNNLYAAFKTTDCYVWFYNERVNWWINHIDSGVAEIIKSVKNGFDKSQNLRKAAFSGVSSENSLEEDKSKSSGFKFNFTVQNRLLTVEFLKELPTDLLIFQNSRLIFETSQISRTMKINLKNIYNYKGNLIILSKYANGNAEPGFVN